MSLNVLNDDVKEKVTTTLQAVVVDLIDLSLKVKQAHWNVRGPQFKPVHEHLDEIADDVRGHTDELAERLVALGVPALGDATNVSSGTRLEPMPDGWLTADAAIDAIAGQMHAVARIGRTAIDQLGGADPVTEDLLVQLVSSVERQFWMLSSNRAR